MLIIVGINIGTRMSSKLDTFEKIQEIIDEEIEKSKQVIIQRCRSLFDKFLGNRITRTLKKSQNSNISLEDVDYIVEEIKQEENEDKDEESESEEEDEEKGESGEEDDEKSSVITGISDKIIIKPNGDIEVISYSDDEVEDDEEEDDIGVYEIEIHDTTYLVASDDPPFIFEKADDESVGDCIGIMHEDEPHLLTTYKGERCYLCTNTGEFYKYIDDTTIGDIIE